MKDGRGRRTAFRVLYDDSAAKIRGQRLGGEPRGEAVQGHYLLRRALADATQRLAEVADREHPGPHHPQGQPLASVGRRDDDPVAVLGRTPGALQRFLDSVPAEIVTEAHITHPDIVNDVGTTQSRDYSGAGRVALDP